MSSPKYDWNANVTWMIRNYPARKSEHDELLSPTLTADMSGIPGGGGGSGRSTETIALRQMAPAKQAEYDAVKKALEITKLLPDGSERIELIRQMYWKGKHVTLSQAVPPLHVSEKTGYRWHRDFKELVGKNFGYRE